MYRIYFRDAAGISGRVDFDAEDDRVAMTTAELLADACSDKCGGFELSLRQSGLAQALSEADAVLRPPQRRRYPIKIAKPQPGIDLA